MKGLAAVAVFWVLTLCVVATQSRRAYLGTLDQHPAIDYRGGALNDVVTLLQRDISSGTTKLTFDAQYGYLQSLLEKLSVPVDSQLLVFSKTGIQRNHTGPENPRALYFNDRVVVGYIPGAPLIEMASLDPRQGVIFQTLSQSPEAAHISRPDMCAGCHLSANSLDVPGILVRSMFVGVDGRALPQLGSFLVDHRSPLEQRWGGWYVTGTHGTARHMGNSVVADLANPAAATTDLTLNRTALDTRVDAKAYPAATSDIVALMVFDHQGRAMNLLTRLGWEARMAAGDGPLDFSKGDLHDALKETVDYLSLVDEALLPGPVEGVSSFSKSFALGGVRDRLGRSLRELDLRTRLFKYRCSYMIYSPAVDALPGEVRAELFKQLRLRVSDPVTLAILDDTKAGWR